MLRSWLVVLSSLAVVAVTGGPSSGVVDALGTGEIFDDGANDSYAVRCQDGTMWAGADNSLRPCGQLFSMSVTSGLGTDFINLADVRPEAFTQLQAISVFAGGGIDTVIGSPFFDYVRGDVFSDIVLSGGGDDNISGAKEVRGEDGNDTIASVSSFASGGAGDDRFVRIAPTLGLDGGLGTDVWELDAASLAGEPGVTFVLDQGALVYTTPGVVPVNKPATTIEQVETVMAPTAQSWDGAGFVGRQDIRGLGGADMIVTGPGRDAVDGDQGDDSVNGGAGSDLLDGGDGNDTIMSRDGEVDLVDCGAGTDTVVADAVDVVVNCETVDLPVVVTPPVVTPPVAVVPVTGAITGPAKVAKPKKASFTFSSPTAGATFQCKVDGKAWKVCASPYKVATKKLKLGKHKLLVRAVVGGAVDATPSKKVFKVVRG